MFLHAKPPKNLLCIRTMINASLVEMSIINKKNNLLKVVAKGVKEKDLKLYKLVAHVFSKKLNLFENFEEAFLWHKQFKHLSFQHLFHLNNKRIATRMPNLSLVS
jgi:hypothetical protein